MNIATLLTWLALYCMIYNISACIPSLGKSLNQIDSYDLVYVNLDKLNTSSIIEFDFQSQRYQLHLEKNDQLSPIINHQTENELIVGHSSSSQQSCHYHGKVLNYDGNSVVALSVCDGKGIRGLINAFDQEIWIYPYQYYLNPQNSTYHHNLIDKHLIYKSHDYAEYPYEARRRLQTAYNNGDNVVEIYTLTDPSFVDHFKASDGNNWYSALYNYLSQVINQATAKYEAVNWGSNIGDISLKWVALDVVESFTGIYSSLYCQPCPQGHINDANQRCMATNSATCNYQDYLDVFVTWYKINKDVTDFDYGIIFASNNVFGANAGWNGDVGYSYWTGICDDDLKAGMISAYSYFGLPEMHALFAHELGHNLGAESHDSSGCSSSDPNNRWIMCSTVGQSTFSTYSIQLIQDAFSDNGGFSCLATRNNPFESNYNGVTQSPSTPTMSPINPPIGCVNEGCYLMSGFSTNIDGSYTVEGCHNDKAYYSSSNGYYLYWSDDFTNWHIYDSLNDALASAYCDENTLDVCSSSNAWLIWDNGWVSAAAADNTVCSTTSPTTVQSNNASKSPTDTPTQSPSIPTTSPTNPSIPCEHEGCYLIKDFSTNIDGTYTVQGCHNDKGYYSSPNGYYLYWSDDFTNWHILTSLDDTIASAYCDENTLDICSSNNAWLIYDNGFVPAPTADNTLCTAASTETPTGAPTKTSTDPSNSPTKAPTRSPTTNPSNTPTGTPTSSPITDPSNSPTKTPTGSPITPPSNTPSKAPTTNPSNTPTETPTGSPITDPSNSPTKAPTRSPTTNPSNAPTKTPTGSPITSPSNIPSKAPTSSPIANPSNSPTKTPTDSPTTDPSNIPSKPPTRPPTAIPSNHPTKSPTLSPTVDQATCSMCDQCIQHLHEECNGNMVAIDYKYKPNDNLNLYKYNELERYVHILIFIGILILIVQLFMCMWMIKMSNWRWKKGYHSYKTVNQISDTEY